MQSFAPFISPFSLSKKFFVVMQGIAGEGLKNYFPKFWGWVSVCLFTTAKHFCLIPKRRRSLAMQGFASTLLLWYKGLKKTLCHARFRSYCIAAYLSAHFFLCRARHGWIVVWKCSFQLLWLGFILIIFDWKTFLSYTASKKNPCHARFRFYCIA